MGSDPPVWNSTSPEFMYQSNTSATPSLRSATNPSSDMDMIATTFDIAIFLETRSSLHDCGRSDVVELGKRSLQVFIPFFRDRVLARASAVWHTSLGIHFCVERRIATQTELRHESRQNTKKADVLEVAFGHQTVESVSASWRPGASDLYSKIALGCRKLHPK